MTRMNKLVLSLAGALGIVALVACGGGDPPITQFLRGIQDIDKPSETQDNVLPLVVDAGPTELVDAGTPALNTLYASVTVCTPGDSSACQTIDHVRIDTASVGLRIVASVLSDTVEPTPVNEVASGASLRECMRFGDGRAWGSVVIADVTIGTRTLSALPLQLISDEAAGTPPANCIAEPDRGTVAALRANGVLGVGAFLRDCGTDCVSGRSGGVYYSCPSADSASCTAIIADASQQLPNPVASLSNDNNGVLIVLPSVPSSGQSSASGNLYFGIDTQDNNALGDAQLHTLDTLGALSTAFDGTTRVAFVDSSAAGTYFDSSSFVACADDASLYCASPVATQSADLQGLDGAGTTVTFSVDDADAVAANDFAAAAGIAGTLAGRFPNRPSAFTWGLPFFYDRSVFVLFEGRTAGGVTGPAIGF
jgi:hypothetical protein